MIEYLRRVYHFDDASNASENKRPILNLNMPNLGSKDYDIDYTLEKLKRTIHPSKQVHGAEFVDADSSTAILENSKADGIFLNKKLKEGEITSTKIAIQTADCLPVLMASSQTNFMMAIHAGWRGLAKGILTNGLNLAGEHSDYSALYVELGPCISPSEFEVGPEVIDEMFYGKNKFSDADLNLCIAKGKEDRWHVDLQAYALCQLHQYGVDPSHVSVYRSCTFKNKNKWPSYRREKRLSSTIWSSIGLRADLNTISTP